MSIEQLNLSSLNKSSDTFNQDINSKLDLAHKNKEKFSKSMKLFLDTKYDNDDYLSVKNKLADLLQLSATLSGLITLLVFIRSELDKIQRVNNILISNNRISSAQKLLTDDLTAYRTVSYSLSQDISTLRDLIQIKFPNERYNIV